ncbi:dTDP-4-amino-4,6-dideoxygalactose transaminase [Roseibium sp.]|uniref:dTDP-4-amino-4,6-dideoxygalactose transaminase n=1 Tax=Roseibium sp. TaxID=1936156 RepID=UPI003BAFD3B3
MNIAFNKPYLANREMHYVAEAVSSGKTSGDGKYGKKCQRILEEMIGFDCRVLLTTSCTAALEIAALLLDIKEGDEVIMPSYTFVSTANAFCLRGAKPVFVDLHPETMNLDLEGVRNAISSRTRAIVPVHYAGMSCDMDQLMALAEENNIPVVEDAAQAITSSYKGRPLGSFGALSTFSFHETKNISCGEGGALVINNKDVLERAEFIREKGTNRANFIRGNVDKYTWVEIGSSYVMSDLLAACLAAQLEEIDQIQNARLNVFGLYMKALQPLAQRGWFRLPATPEYNRGNAHMMYLIVEDGGTRNALIDHLSHHGIGAAFHYVPLHSSPVGKRYGYGDGDLPNTENLAGRLIRLPMHASLSEAEIHRVIEEVAAFFEPARTEIHRTETSLAS